MMKTYVLTCASALLLLLGSSTGARASRWYDEGSEFGRFRFRDSSRFRRRRQPGGTGFYHNGRSVSIGDRKFEVLRVMGKPTWQDTRYEDVVVQTGRDEWVVREIAIDEWYYDLGPTRFTRTLIFENGKLAKTEHGTYGGDRDRAPSLVRCLDRLAEGERKGNVLMRCGRPDYTDRYREERIRRVAKNEYRTVHVQIDEWTYNAGPLTLLRTLTFENGKLVSIEKGDYGY
jgi:hypothetical protein